MKRIDAALADFDVVFGALEAKIWNERGKTRTTKWQKLSEGLSDRGISFIIDHFDPSSYQGYQSPANVEHLAIIHCTVGEPNAIAVLQANLISSSQHQRMISANVCKSFLHTSHSSSQIHDWEFHTFSFEYMPRFESIGVDVVLAMWMKETCIAALSHSLLSRRISKPEDTPTKYC